jgi:hypothetical protein
VPRGLDTEKYTIVGESHGTGWFRPIGVLEVAGQPLILVEKIRQWVLIRPDGSEAVPYAWDCPEEKCIGQISYRARLIDRGVFPEGPSGRDTAWGFVHGAVFETEAPYNLRHPQTQPCPWRETLPNGPVSCIFLVDLMLRIPWDTLDMAEGWILREYDGRGEDQIVRVLRVDGDAVEYLETPPGKGHRRRPS